MLFFPFHPMPMEIAAMSYLNRRDFVKFAAGVTAWALVPPLFAEEKKAEKKKADPYADAVFQDGEPPLPASDSFTIIVLPDTQHYCESHPTQYLAQTEWILKNRDSRKIACVLHLGDITNKNTDKEWKVAKEAMSRLDGAVPYFLVPGNHDYTDGKNGFKTRNKCKIDEYFPIAKFRDLPTFGGAYDKEPEHMKNTYHLFSAGGRDFLVLALEFGPRNDVIRWANAIADKYKDREAILITHAYMYSDETRYDWKKFGTKQAWNPHGYEIAKADGDDVNDGEDLWNKLISKQGNFILTLNGHVLNDGLARITSKTPDGREVPQMLVNFQMKPNGGDGWLRLLEFHADRQTIDAIDFSPSLKKCNVSPQNKFSVKITPIKR
jgi:predicted phosphodiesterase